MTDFAYDGPIFPGGGPIESVISEFACINTINY